MENQDPYYMDNAEDFIFDPRNKYIFQMKSRGLDKWWFFDKSYWDHGPYVSFEEAKEAMWIYIETLTE